jgi:DNA invertase Pin-like site-specific DNA recombinase
MRQKRHVKDMKKYITYCRRWPKKGSTHPDVSTQEEEARRLVQFNEGVVLSSYTEKEQRWTDPQDVRPELAKAIEHAIRSEATIVVAFLGRLGRNVPFTRAMLNSGVDFVCCDAPKANRLTIHIMAATAEDESRKVSERVRNSLAAASARGVKLGSNRPGHWEGREHKRGTKKAIAAAARKKRTRTRNTYAFLMPEIKARRERGETLPEIVDWLNQQGHTTTAGKPFTQTAVWRLIKRYLGKELLGNNKRKMAHVSP